MNLVRRLLFAGINAALAVGLIYSVVNAPTLLAGSTFEAIPRTLDGTPVQHISEIVEDDTIIVVEVWWQLGCKACYKQLDLMETVHAPPYLYVIAVNVGGAEKKVAKIIEERGWDDFSHVIGLETFPQGASGSPFTITYSRQEDGSFAIWDQWNGFIGKVNDRTQSLIDELNRVLQGGEE